MIFPNGQVKKGLFKNNVFTEEITEVENETDYENSVIYDSPPQK